MTNDKTQQIDNQKTVQKKKKTKGPIRTGAVVPTIIILALIYSYFYFFFDNHVRRTSEYVLTQIHGAEVNIGVFKTSFLNLSMKIGNIQITDKNRPERDLFRVGEINFGMMWDALLRMKIVIEEGSILNIQALVPRAKPGYVVPPPPPEKEGESTLAKVQNQVLAQTREKFKDNFLGDISALVSGVDYKDQLKAIEGDLKSSLRLKELDAGLKQKRDEWDKRFKELPQQKELKELEARMKALNWKEKDPVKFAKTLNDANSLIKEVKAKLKQVDDTQKDLRGDIGTYSQLVKDVEGYIKQDLADLQQRMKIPNIDPKEFTQQLFMQQIEQRLVSVRKYVEVARKYMPPQKTAAEKAKEKEEQLLPRKRGQGKNYQFPVVKGYPLFWLKHAKITSSLGQSELSGNISGQIFDLTTHPTQLQRPTKIEIKGEFPKQKIAGLIFEAVIDHTKDVAREMVDMKIAQFPVGQLKLSDSKDVKLQINNSAGAVQLTGIMTGGEFNIDTRSQYDQLDYEIDAKSSVVKEILTAIFKGIPGITLNANIKGSWDKFSINMNSNLGQALSDGFKKQLEAKVEEAKQKLKAELDKRIGAERANLEKQLQGFTKDLESQLGAKKSELDKAAKDAEAQVKNESNGLIKKDDMKKLEKEGQKVLKGIFGG